MSRGKDPRQPGRYPACPQSSGTGRVFSKHPSGIAVRLRSEQWGGQGPRARGGDLRGTRALQDDAQLSRSQHGLTINTEDWRLPPTSFPHPESPLDSHKYSRSMLPLDKYPSQKRRAQVPHKPSPIHTFTCNQLHPEIFSQGPTRSPTL